MGRRSAGLTRLIRVASLLLTYDGESIAKCEQPRRQVGELFGAKEVIAAGHDGLLEPLA